MKSIRTLLTASVLAAGALATGMTMAAAADETNAAMTAPAPGAYGWHHHHREHWLAQLNLTAQQQASVKTIMEGAMPQMKSIHEEMRANSLKLRQTQPNDPNYASVVAQITQANGSLHSQMITQHESVRAQVFQVLTPAQQTQLAALQAQAANRPHGAWGQHGAAPTPPPAQ